MESPETTLPAVYYKVVGDRQISLATYRVQKRTNLRTYLCGDHDRWGDRARLTFFAETAALDLRGYFPTRSAAVAHFVENQRVVIESARFDIARAETAIAAALALDATEDDSPPDATPIA